MLKLIMFIKQILLTAILILISGCVFKGRNYAKDQFVLGEAAHQAKNYIKAREHWKTGCDLDLNRACNKLADLERWEFGNIDRAHEYWIKACDLKYGKGCWWAGVLEEDRFGNRDKAKEFYKRACDFKHAQACESYKRLNK